MEERNLTQDEIVKLFGSEIESFQENAEEEETTTEKDNTNEEKPQESRGVEESKKGEDAKSDGNSPNNLYSSIAKALKEEGILSDLDDISSIIDAKSLRDAFNMQADKRLDNQTKRVLLALNSGMRKSDIQILEELVSTYNSIDAKAIESEDKNGESIRKELLYRDYINRGFSKEKAEREIKKAFDAGTDIEDAKDALVSLREYTAKMYEKKQMEAEAAKKAAEDAQKSFFDSIIKSIDEKENAFNSIKLDANAKKRIKDVIFDRKHKNPQGYYESDIEKYEREHKADFARYMAAFFALTDGFTDFSKLFKPVANQAMKKGLANLENMLQGSTVEGGSLSLIGGTEVSDDLKDLLAGNYKISV